MAMNIAWDRDGFTLIPEPADHLLKRRGGLQKEKGNGFICLFLSFVKQHKMCFLHLIFVS